MKEFWKKLASFCSKLFCRASSQSCSQCACEHCRKALEEAIRAIFLDLLIDYISIGSNGGDNEIS